MPDSHSGRRKVTELYLLRATVLKAKLMQSQLAGKVTVVTSTPFLQANSVPGQFSHIVQVKQVKVIVKSFKKPELVFSSDVFVGVAVVVA